MFPHPTIDTNTRVARIRDLCNTLQSAWLARPSLGDPLRAVWEGKCHEELIRLKDLVRHVREDTPVPPIVLAFLVEHNRAFTAHERKYNYEAITPTNSHGKAGFFYKDETYQFCMKDAGWWVDLGAFITPMHARRL